MALMTRLDTVQHDTDLPSRVKTMRLRQILQDARVLRIELEKMKNA
jgi:hypothetical protein